jgi:hypothetical protein
MGLERMVKKALRARSLRARRHRVLRFVPLYGGEWHLLILLAGAYAAIQAAHPVWVTVCAVSAGVYFALAELAGRHSVYQGHEPFRSGMSASPAVRRVGVAHLLSEEFRFASVYEEGRGTVSRSVRRRLRRMCLQATLLALLLEREGVLKDEASQHVLARRHAAAAKFAAGPEASQPPPLPDPRMFSRCVVADLRRIPRRERVDVRQCVVRGHLNRLDRQEAELLEGVEADPPGSSAEPS